MNHLAWDGVSGTAGGAEFGTSLAAFAAERGVSDEQLCNALECTQPDLQAIVRGEQRIGVAALARLTQALRSKPIEFMQKTGMLSLEVYAAGLDPLYFLPEGPIRYEARIYMREINPRHPVPEADMTRRNPTLKALAEESMLDPLGRIEMELAYLLRLAVQQTGGALPPKAAKG